MKNENYSERSKLFTFLFITWSAIILFLASYPKLHNPISDKIWNSDKLAHLTVYTIFSWLFIKMNQHKTKNDNLKNLVVMLFTIPILDELHQWPIPGRTFSFYDIIADSIGFLIIIISYYYKKN